MKVQVEIAILEKSILCSMIENVLERYMTINQGDCFNRQGLLNEISNEIEAIKELNLISFYEVSSFVELKTNKENENEPT